MKIGTKSVLFGPHQFLIHPFFVAAAWWKLFGFPWDPRLWVAFFVHDLGYLGKPNMDGIEGESHPILGAAIMTSFFDGCIRVQEDISVRSEQGKHLFWVGKWGQLALFHSRYFAKRSKQPFSRLCLADKLAIALTPAWLYLPMVKMTGEIKEYLSRAKTADSIHWKCGDYSENIRIWYEELQTYMREWVETHRDMRPDTWTNADRHASRSGVWK